MYFSYTNIDKDDNHVIDMNLWYSDRILAIVPPTKQAGDTSSPEALQRAHQPKYPMPIMSTI